MRSALESAYRKNAWRLVRSADRNDAQILHLTLSCALAAAGLIGSAVSSGLTPRLTGLTVALIVAISAAFAALLRLVGIGTRDPRPAS